MIWQTARRSAKVRQNHSRRRAESPLFGGSALALAIKEGRMSCSRRSFLQTALGSTTLLAVGSSVPTFLARSAQAALAARQDRVLVVVQLSGGNDGLNTVIPFADPAYRANRIALRIAADQVVKVDDQVGLHPQLAPLAELLEKRRLAIVQGVGYPNPDRSHFRSMDIWQSARLNTERLTDGWLGRYVEQLPSESGGDLPAMHLGSGQLPLALASTRKAVASIDSLDRFRVATTGNGISLKIMQTLASQPRPHENSLLQFVQRSTLGALSASSQVQAALASQRSPIRYPEFGLARRLQSIAQLIDAGFRTRIYYVSLDGFDTHANQLPGHAALLGELAQSLAAFVDDLEARGHLDRVVVMTFSEFGRRVRENASQGTDHGAAAPMLLAGGGVQSGPIGGPPQLDDLDAEGDLKFHTDFRQVYATLLDDWLGCSSEAVLGEHFEPVPLLI
jgi:uncharacterized protein (DUF1501 family)